MRVSDKLITDNSVIKLPYFSILERLKRVQIFLLKLFTQKNIFLANTKNTTQQEKEFYQNACGFGYQKFSSTSSRIITCFVVTGAWS